MPETNALASQFTVYVDGSEVQQDVMTKVVSTVQLHERLRKCDFIKKYVHISTPEVYGSCSGLVQENKNYAPSTPYAVSRAAADMSLMTWSQQYDFPVVFTRG